jgi:hypothetical protein
MRAVKLRKCSESHPCLSAPVHDHSNDDVCAIIKLLKRSNINKFSPSVSMHAIVFISARLIAWRRGCHPRLIKSEEASLGRSKRRRLSLALLAQVLRVALGGLVFLGPRAFSALQGCPEPRGPELVGGGLPEAVHQVPEWWQQRTVGV